MQNTLARKGMLIATAMLLAIGFGMTTPASATDSTTWHPSTPTGGAPADPSYWDNQARIPFSGAGSSIANVTLAPQVVNSTTYDYSKPVTNVAGGQSNTVVTTNSRGTTSTTVETVTGH